MSKDSFHIFLIQENFRWHKFVLIKFFYWCSILDVGLITNEGHGNVFELLGSDPHALSQLMYTLIIYGKA